MTNYKRGDVVLVLFPDSNLQTAKKRPTLVVQANNLQTCRKSLLQWLQPTWHGQIIKAV